MKLVTVFELEDLRKLQYPIIVESWDKAMGSMRFKREYSKEFTEQERATIRRYYYLFCKWHLVKGTPDEHRMKIATYNLLQRAVAFFASN